MLKNNEISRKTKRKHIIRRKRVGILYYRFIIGKRIYCDLFFLPQCMAIIN